MQPSAKYWKRRQAIVLNSGAVSRCKVQAKVGGVGWGSGSLQVFVDKAQQMVAMSDS